MCCFNSTETWLIFSHCLAHKLNVYVCIFLNVLFHSNFKPVLLMVLFVCTGVTNKHFFLQMEMFSLSTEMHLYIHPHTNLKIRMTCRDCILCFKQRLFSPQWLSMISASFSGTGTVWQRHQENYIHVWRLLPTPAKCHRIDHVLFVLFKGTLLLWKKKYSRFIVCLI